MAAPGSHYSLPPIHSRSPLCNRFPCPLPQLGRLTPARLKYQAFRENTHCFSFDRGPQNISSQIWWHLLLVSGLVWQPQSPPHLIHTQSAHLVVSTSNILLCWTAGKVPMDLSSTLQGRRKLDSERLRSFLRTRQGVKEEISGPMEEGVPAIPFYR